MRRQYLQIRVHDREEDLHEEIDCIDDDTEQVQPCFAYESVKLPVEMDLSLWKCGWRQCMLDEALIRRRVDEVGGLMALLAVMTKLWFLGFGVGCGLHVSAGLIRDCN